MQKTPFTAVLAATAFVVLLVTSAVSQTTTARPGTGEDAALVRRVAGLERRLEVVEHILRAKYTEDARREASTLLQSARTDVAEQLRTKVTEYLTAAGDESADAGTVRRLGLEVDRHRKLLQSIVDKQEAADQ